MSALTLRISAKHRNLLRAMAAEPNEQIALGLVGSLDHDSHPAAIVASLKMVEEDLVTRRTPVRVGWNVQAALEHLDVASGRGGMGLLKVHSHPSGTANFSAIDDAADADLFAFADEYVGAPRQHLSAIVLPDGSLVARRWYGGRFTSISRALLLGDGLVVQFAEEEGDDLDQGLTRNVQMFGVRTIRALRRLSVAVVGCSGTGCHVIEQLARLGVGRLVLVDPDHVDLENLNRILQATREDAESKSPKVEVMRRHVSRLGFGTSVEAYCDDVEAESVTRAVASCDYIFGCVDSVIGREVLNKIATFYCLPYCDLGVRIDADGVGGVDGVWATVHHIEPGGSSLLTRGVYDHEQLRAERHRQEDPDLYAEFFDEGYIKGVDESSPAVISLNGLVASAAVLDFMARLHPYRDGANSDYQVIQFDLRHGMLYCREDDAAVDLSLAEAVGRGDTAPLLNLSA